MTAEPGIDPEERPTVRGQLRFPVVGIGASAGGIDALQRLLPDMPGDCGMAFVVVMHLSPDHVSTLGPILQRAGKLPVTTVRATTRIEASHVYVISPAMALQMSDGELQVHPSSMLEGRQQTINHFFRSLAQAHEERAVCIVLSGTGNDGAQGMQRIKELGGVTLAQTPSDAQFDGMPRAALETGQVDFELPVAEMPAKLMQLWKNASQIELPAPPAGLDVEPSSESSQQQAEEALLSIKALLRERTGHDFTHYKRGTVLRRLERRMQVNAVTDLPSYRRLLDVQPKETQALLQDMLISVTNFFRDPKAFGALQATLVSSTAERAVNDPFRVWVAGCATGEEAYSIVMVLREVLGKTAPPSQIFASDIDQRAVSAARAGRYPSSIAIDIPEALLTACFVSEANGYRIFKNLRDQVVFSVHNVLSDPPFTLMDLISCRNLMIYLDRPAQEQLLRSLHYALKPRGLLFLGSSETADAAGQLFEVVDKANRIYRAAVVPQRSRVFPPVPMRIPAPVDVPRHGSVSRTSDRPPLENLHDRVLKAYSPPSILVDADDTILHVSERAAHLLRMPEGAPSSKLMALVRPELRPELRAALLRAAKSGKVVEAPKVQLRVNGQMHVVTITARPAVDDAPKGLMLVVFDEVEESLAIDPGAEPRRDPMIDALEEELVRAHRQLRTMAGETAASTEELRASNEELQTINEELRSTTEELETSREELQSVNEELITVNAELSIRVEEAAKVTDDLQNLMTSADIGTVFVDRDMCVKRFTPQAATLFNLLPADLGRPLLDLSHRLVYPDLVSDIAGVLCDLNRVEREIQSTDGRWFASRIAPYRTSEDRIEGAVLALFDVTSRKAAEEQLRETEQRMAMVVDSMRDYAIITLDGRGEITSWSAGAQRIFDYEAAEIVGQPFDVLFIEADRLADRPQQELRKARVEGRADDDRWHRRKDGERIFVSGITTPLGEGGAMGFAKIARDYTDLELRQQRRDLALATEMAKSKRLHKASAMKDEFLAIVSHELKNPLSLILMHAELLSRLPGMSTDAKALRSTGAIRSAVAAQAQIITDLLELSRANTGKIKLVMSQFDLTEVVQNVCEAAGPDASAKQLSLDVDLNPAVIEADHARIEQVVWNLLTNAIKFTPQGGAIEVRLRTEASQAVLQIRDDGIGIEEQDLATIFEIFRQIDGGPSRKASGLGIGLALVKQLVEMHGGRVDARSDGPGKGAVFTVSMPLADVGYRPTEAAAPETTLHGMRILVVDDEPDQAAVLGAVLESEGAVATLAGGADEALAIALANAASFDAIISDIAMPGRDGFWLAKQLRDAQATRKIPLLGLSGMVRPSERQRALDAGFDNLLSKPVNLHSMFVELRQAIERRSQSRPDLA